MGKLLEGRQIYVNINSHLFDLLTICSCYLYLKLYSLRVRHYRKLLQQVNQITECWEYINTTNISKIESSFNIPSNLFIITLFVFICSCKLKYLRDYNHFHFYPNFCTYIHTICISIYCRYDKRLTLYMFICSKISNI